MKTNRNSFEYNFSHTQQRLKERHGISLTEKAYKQLCKNYEEGQYEIISPEDSNNQIVFKGYIGCTFDAKPIKFVWCTRRGRITTALP